MKNAQDLNRSKIEGACRAFIKKTRRRIRIVLALSRGTDAEGTIEEISKNVAIRGSNIWMLVCSSVLASLGLDINSTAVLIGAMLISPLMSPILGVGLGVGILDRKLLRESLKNLVLATFISLAASGIYFLISPLGEITNEISSRTTPTILDVGIAFFGGVAGIVAGSRRDKTSAIPGVAIATALMPPICVAGYGLAKFSSKIFLGAFYLFFINAFFIGLATYLIVVWLKFPKRSQLDGVQRVRVVRFIIGFAVLMIIPSGFIFFNVLHKLNFDRNVKSFVNTEIRNDYRQPVQWDVLQTTTPPTLKVYIVGRAVGPDEGDKLQADLNRYGVGSLMLKFVQLNVSPDEFQRLSSNVETDVTEKIKVMQSVEEKRKIEIDQLRADLLKLKENTDPDIVFLKEVKRRFPQVSDVFWQDPATAPPDNASNPERVLFVTFTNEVDYAAKENIKDQIMRLARSRFDNEEIQIVEPLQNEPESEPPPDPDLSKP